MRYLVKMKPLEPFAFGTDQGFGYPGEAGTGKESYFVRTREFPEQTTILGMLRYQVLSDRQLLKTSFEYTQEEQAKMAEAIGKSSFCFSAKEKQSFGSIREISPVFILNEKGEIYIRNPFHNRAAKKGYEPITMGNEAVVTSAGEIKMPLPGQYNAKIGYGSGFYNLTTGEICGDLFGTHVVTGNCKNRGEDTDKDAYFKREIKSLKTGCCFAVYVEADRLPEQAIVSMGQKRSAFHMTAEETTDESLEMQVEAAFHGKGEVWYYALSDLLVESKADYHHFCIVEEKSQRNLETVYNENARHRKLKKSMVRYHLVGSGSVFYENCDLQLKSGNCEQIGYNKLVRLGGE